MADTQHPDTQPDTRADIDLDRLERSIEIRAGADAVFDLVSQPGWWINQASLETEPKLRHEGEVTTLVHPQFGLFRFQLMASERPTYLSSRWLDREDPTAWTTVEFWITEEEARESVTLRVVESGFTGLGNTDDQVRQHLAENAEGWESGLAAARDVFTPAQD